MQHYRIMDASHVTATRPLLAFDPYATTMAPIMKLAKAANVPLYPGYPGGPMFIEQPDAPEDREAMDQLSKELGLVAWGE